MVKNNVFAALFLLITVLVATGCGAGKGYGHQAEAQVVTKYYSEPLPGSLQPTVDVPFHYSSTSRNGYFREEGRGTLPLIGSSYVMTPDGRWIQVGYSDKYTYGFTNEVQYPPWRPIPWTRIP